MKILQVISYFYPAWAYGGPGKLVYDLSTACARRGNRVTVYTTDALTSQDRREVKDNLFLKDKNISVRFLRNISNTLAYRFKIFLPPTAIFTIWNEITSFDIVHIHEFFTPLAAVSCFFAKKYHVPYVFSTHGTLSKFHFAHRKDWKKLFMAIAGKFMIKNASHFIAATPVEIKEYHEFGVPEEDVTLIPNGIEFHEFEGLPKRGSFRKRNQIKDNEKILLYLGRINKLKGLDMLIRAFSKVRKRFSATKLIIAGSDDGYLSALISMTENLSLKDSVLFPGITSGIKKLKMYVDTDIFVYPSPAEGFSIAILEAAAVGLPLVITKGCKFPEVDRAKAGIVVESDEEELYKAIYSILKDESFRRKAGLNAKKLVKENFSIEKMTLRLENLYKQVCKQYERH